MQAYKRYTEFRHLKPQERKNQGNKLNQFTQVGENLHHEEQGTTQSVKSKVNTRKKERTGQWRTLKRRQSLMQFVLDFHAPVQGLQGDCVQPPSPYLNMSLRLGGTFTPFVHPKHDLKQWVQHFGREFDELDRVLTWSIDFTLHPPDNEPDSYRELPYNAFHPKRYTLPFSDVYNKIPYPTIEQAIQRAKHYCFQALGVFEREDYTTRGVQWHRFLVDEWHEAHVVVPSDKDGSYVPMTVDAYLSEQEAHLRDKSRKGDKIYHKLSETSKTSIDFWLKEGRQR